MNVLIEEGANPDSRRLEGYTAVLCGSGRTRGCNQGAAPREGEPAVDQDES